MQHESIAIKPYVSFCAKEVIIEANQNVFSVKLSRLVADENLSLIIDIYDLDAPIHPVGHIGWWQFPIDVENKVFNIQLNQSVQGIYTLSIDGLTLSKCWVNSEKVNCKRLQLTAVLRSIASNAIIALDTIPAFFSLADHQLFRQHDILPLEKNAYATACYFPLSTTKIHILSQNMFMKDGVGNFCFDIYRLLKQNNMHVSLYANVYDLSLNKMINPMHTLLEQAKKEDVILYFFSTYDPFLETLLALPSKKIAYFHGITKPELLRVFDFELSYVCAQAMEQLVMLSQFDMVLANSHATARFLEEKMGADKKQLINIIPPRLYPAETVKRSPVHSSKNTKFIYVGRIKSHKKIEDILLFFSYYILLDNSAECFIVGQHGDAAYMNYLLWTQQNYFKAEDSSKIHWLGHVADHQLQTIYQDATAYISMSEDEGFCIPLVEAMLENIPVFSYAVPAVCETMGDAGVRFYEKDFSVLAKLIYDVLHDKERIKSILHKQQLRVDALLKQMTGEPILKLFEPMLVNDRNAR